MTDWQMTAAGLYVPPTAPDGAYLPRKDGARFADFLRLVDGAGTSVSIDPDTGEVSVDATGAGFVTEVQPGTNVTVDNTDPTRPIVSASTAGSGAWDKKVDLPLTTLTGWTVGTGAWSASAAGIRQSDTANTVRRLHLDGVLDLAECWVEVEVKVDTATNTTNGRAGIVIGTPATDNIGGNGAFLSTNGSLTQIAKVHSESEGAVAWFDTAISAIATGTWITLRVHSTVRTLAFYVNGTLITNHIGVDGTLREWRRIALYTNAVDATFRNLKFWNFTNPT